MESILRFGPFCKIDFTKVKSILRPMWSFIPLGLPSVIRYLAIPRSIEIRGGEISNLAIKSLNSDQIWLEYSEVLAN